MMFEPMWPPRAAAAGRAPPPPAPRRPPRLGAPQQCPAMLVALIIGAALVADAAAAAAAAPPINIANSTQLFVDDFIIGSMANLTRILHSPDCSHPVIAPDAPWEQNRSIGTGGTTILADGGKIRAWYITRNASLGCSPGGVPGKHDDQPPCADHLAPQPNYEEPYAGPVYLSYAESVDGGRTFTKPLLGRQDIGGNTSNNVVLLLWDGGLLKGDGFTVMIDPTQAVGSAQRYRGVTGNLLLHSPDGFNWTASGIFHIPCLSGRFTGPGCKGNTFDTQAVLLWDPPCSCYSFYTRWYTWNGNKQQREVRRARARNLTAHWINHTQNWWNQSVGVGDWENQTIVLAPDALDLATNRVNSSGFIGPVDFYGSTPWYKYVTSPPRTTRLLLPCPILCLYLRHGGWELTRGLTVHPPACTSWPSNGSGITTSCQSRLASMTSSWLSRETARTSPCSGGAHPGSVPLSREPRAAAAYG